MQMITTMAPMILDLQKESDQIHHEHSVMEAFALHCRFTSGFVASTSSSRVVHGGFFV